MPVPKRKTSKSRRDMRSAGKFLRPQAFSVCSNCAVPVVPHVVCDTCGYYKGRKIFKTKLDRALKRGEVRQNLVQKQQAAQDVEAQSKSE
jgi:large subunit ribosomal protein L32